MSNSPLVVYTKLSPNCTKPRNHVIDTISIHCMGGNLSVEACLNLPRFQNYDPINGSSCNYAIDSKGRIGLCVDEANRSWCTSSKTNDHRAVTIEVANIGGAPDWPVSDEAYKALIALVADICKRNNIKRLLWKGDKSLIGQVDKQNMTVHRWFANKACPGNYLYNRHADIANQVNKLIEEEVKPVAKLDNTPDSYAKESINWALQNRILLGDDTGNLKLHEPVTRQDMLVFLKRTYDLMKKGYSTSL